MTIKYKQLCTKKKTLAGKVLSLECVYLSSKSVTDSHVPDQHTEENIYN